MVYLHLGRCGSLPLARMIPVVMENLLSTKGKTGMRDHTGRKTVPLNDNILRPPCGPLE